MIDFVYKEHFSQTEIFANSVPVSAVTGINIFTEVTRRKRFSLKAEPTAEVVPISRFYKIELSMTPVPEDDFTFPEGIFNLSVMDATGHTVYRGCSVSEIRQEKGSGTVLKIIIEAGKRLEFNNYKYFGGAKCLMD